MKIRLFDNSSQMIGPKIRLKFEGFDGGYPGVVIRKLGEDWSKTLPVGLFFSKFQVGVTTLGLTKPPHLQQTAIV